MTSSKYFLLSLLLHSSVLVALLFYFLSPISTLQVGMHAVPTYFYQPKNLLSHSIAKPLLRLNPTQSHKTSIVKKIFSQHSAALSKSLPAANNENQHVSTSVLLTMLHQAIAAQQVYPALALQLNQSGTVTVRFLITPNGQVQNINLQKSSGYSNLDAAALAAVEAIAPVKTIGSYLKAPAYFSVDIIFEK